MRLTLKTYKDGGNTRIKVNLKIVANTFIQYFFIKIIRNLPDSCVQMQISEDEIQADVTIIH